MFPRFTSENGHLSLSFLEEILQQKYNTCFCEIRRNSFPLHSHFHFSFVRCVLGGNWGPTSGSRCSNNQKVVLSPTAERGWWRVPKLSQCALRDFVGIRQHQKSDGWKCIWGLGWAILSTKNEILHLTSELACRLDALLQRMKGLSSTENRHANASG